jgi:hypothetical protein
MADAGSTGSAATNKLRVANCAAKAHIQRLGLKLAAVRRGEKLRLCMAG